MEKQMLSMNIENNNEGRIELKDEEMGRVAGGSGSSDIFYIHSNCGGHLKLEDSGIYHADVWLTCPKCGKTWHPHSYGRLERMDGIDDVYTVVEGSF